MKLVGLDFKKISVEKFSKTAENIKINTNIDISDIGKLKSDLLKEGEDLLEIGFKYEITYEPDMAKIELNGRVLLTVDSKEGKNILRDWKKKKLADEFKLSLFNIILKKSSIKALELEEDMNLPYHIQLPRLTANKE